MNRVKSTQDLELKERLVAVNRVTKVTKGGRTFTFAAIVVVGNEAGIVGWGLGKAGEVTAAIAKGVEAAKKNLSGSRQEEFLGKLVKMQIANLRRIENEVEWFTKKFDYRNKDADWGNSRDAVSRSIEKLTGITGLEK